MPNGPIGDKNIKLLSHSNIQINDVEYDNRECSWLCFIEEFKVLSISTILACEHLGNGRGRG